MTEIQVRRIDGNQGIFEIIQKAREGLLLQSSIGWNAEVVILLY